MTTRITQSSAGTLMAAGVFIGLCFNECLASEKCKENAAQTKHVCVVWDRELEPVEGSDFTVSYTCGGCSDHPAVALVVGDDTWEVYSEVISTGAPANIGALTTPYAENYVVKLANGAGAGAADVSSMVLEPDGAHHSSIESGSRISGNAGRITLQESGGSGGTLSLTIDGNALGDITVATISYLSIGEDLSGKVVADDISGAMTIEGDMLDEIELDEITGSLTITGDVDSLLWLTESSSGTITTGPVKGLVTLNQADDTIYSGTATFESVVSGGTVMTLMGALGGTIHVTHDMAGVVAAVAFGTDTGLLEGGKIQVDGDVSGSIVVWEDSEGDIEIGGALTSTGMVVVKGDIAGDVDITGDVDGDIIANYLETIGGDITGQVTIDGEFNGEICGDNLSPMMEWPPDNISIDDFGDDGTICGGAPGCGDGTISSSDPADGTRDSRQPHPVNDCSLAARQGIGSEDEPIEITLSQSGAGGVLCWQLCESGIESVDTGQGCSSLSANDIAGVTETSSGVYEIVLDRPISAGEWTTISYLGDDSYVTYASLPADAEADGQSASDDYTAIVNYLNQVDTPPYGEYSTDMDHSGVFNYSDPLRLIDLLNGASKFKTWYAATLPTNTCP